MDGGERHPDPEGPSVLFVGRDPRLEAMASAAGARGSRTLAVGSAAEALRAHLDGDPFDLVVVLLPLPDRPAGELLGELIGHDRDLAVILAGTDRDVQGAGDAHVLGAADYLPDPRGEPEQLLTAFGVALGARRSREQLRYLRRRDAAGASFDDLDAGCSAMREVVATARQICLRTARGGTPTLLVTGETGTGKGLLTRVIHYNSVRRSAALVEVNCAAVPASLLEAELFGFERGAFTDARAARAGLVETADGGTLFLDEIGSMPPAEQAKLLTVIESKRVRRIGGRREIPVDVQVVAATHRDPEAMVRLGELRADLFHRLDVVRLHLPPLRERGDARVRLAETFLDSLCREYGVPGKRLGDGARRAIEAYSWPGNVRELRNRVERLVLLEDASVVDARHLRLEESGADVEIAAGHGSGLTVRLPEDGCSLEQLEREVIRQVVARCDGNVSAAARYLDITRQTLIYRMQKHGIVVGSA